MIYVVKKKGTLNNNINLIYDNSCVGTVCAKWVDPYLYYEYIKLACVNLEFIKDKIIQMLIPFTLIHCFQLLRRYYSNCSFLCQKLPQLPTTTMTNSRHMLYQIIDVKMGAIRVESILTATNQYIIGNKVLGVFKSSSQG